MERSSSPGNSFEETAASGAPDSPPVVGDADAVQKTTYVVGHGTDAGDRRPAEEAAPERTASGVPPYDAPRRGTGGPDHSG
jgi:hypothetical protein